MTVISRVTPIVLAFLLITGCSSDKKAALAAPPAQEITLDAIGHYCGMTLQEHVGPKGQIFLVNQESPVWFTTIKQVFAYTFLPEEPKSIAAIYVTDMSGVGNWQQPEPGAWIDAKHAFYVIESKFIGGMGAEDALPFSDQAKAQVFINQHGGRIVSFADMPEKYILHYEDAARSSEPLRASHAKDHAS